MYACLVRWFYFYNSFDVINRMMNNRLLKFLSFGLLLVLVLILMAGSVLEKLIGTSSVYELVYTSPVTLVCWGVMAVCALCYLWCRQVQKTWVTFALHVSFILILLGALTTHLIGVQGTIHLRQGEEGIHTFELTNKEKAELPFSVALNEFELEYYAGTFSPMDYVSQLVFTASDGSRSHGKVSMNHICTHHHYRFYQSGYDRDGEGTVLAISYDPYGILLTYIGYVCLLLSMIGFFIQRKSRFHALLKHPILKKMGTGCLLPVLVSAAWLTTIPSVVAASSPAASLATLSPTTSSLAALSPAASSLATLSPAATSLATLSPAATSLATLSSAASSPTTSSPTTSESAKHPRVLSKKAAAAFGDLYIYYNDRICPMQTVAKDFTIKLYGKSTYKGLSAEQVLSGWFFFYDDWKEQPMIRIKDGETRRLLEIDESYACITDFIDEHGYKLQAALEQNTSAGVNLANEKFNLVSMASTGSLFKIYPYRLPENHVSVWYSLADRIPRSIPREEWLFMRNSMNYVAEKVAMRDYKEVIRLFGKIKQYQEKRGDDLPSKSKFTAEKWYNTTNINKPLAMASVAIGILTFGFFCHLLLSKKKSKKLTLSLLAVMALIALYLGAHLSLRGYISGHLPMSDGFETMLFMAFCTSVFTLIAQRKFTMALPFGFLICGLSMMVAMLGESNPKVTNLIPVLQSPLLSIHVVVIMIAYSLLAFTMLNGVTALIFHFSKRECTEEIEYLSVVSRIILYPAVFSLTIGIFVGAVWANVSWGRYWGWDPKEVWALITMLVYSLALHPSLSWFKRPMFLHVFCIIAFLTVLITYFGVNFLLGGKHSYA